MEVGEMTAPRWGVPDWRDEYAYPGAETPMHEWRWQFLRRRPDYRAFWLERAKEDFEFDCRLAERMQKDDPEYPSPEWALGWQVRASFFGGSSSTLDPSFPHFQPGIFEATGGDNSVWRARYEDENAATAAGLISVQFDLNRPIPEQIAKAEKLLKTKQVFRHGDLVKGGRQHMEKWCTYLRVIDARDDRQSWAVINREMLGDKDEGGPQAARQVWEQATGLMFKTGC